MSRNFLLIDPEERPDVLRGLASPVRVKILRALHLRGGLNVNDIADLLELPQSTVSSNLQILEEAGLIKTETQKARKGNQKICRAAFDEVLVMFKEDVAATRPDYLLILPWNLREEIMRQMAAIRTWGGRFVTAIPAVEVHA